MEQNTNYNDPDLDSMIAQLDQRQLDIVFVEGFKHSILKKIEVYRKELRHDHLFPYDQNIIAIASDCSFIPDC